MILKEVLQEFYKGIDGLESLNSTDIWEKTAFGYKYILYFYGAVYEKDLPFIHLRFVFLLNENKEDLYKNTIFYLKDLNCIYNSINFNKIEDISILTKEIIENNNFSDTLKSLSETMFYMSTNISQYLKNGYSLIYWEYIPPVNIIKCEELYFEYNYSLNNNKNGNLILKYNDNEKIFEFELNINNLKTNNKFKNLNEFAKCVADSLNNIL